MNWLLAILCVIGGLFLVLLVARLVLAVLMARRYAKGTGQ